MENVLYLLLIVFGALLMVSIFHFSIYLQQKDKAFLYYGIYLLVMSAFTATRIFDERLTNIYPLSYHTVETIDPILSNTGFLMYVNFLGVILNITKADRFYYYSWRTIQKFVILLLITYAAMQFFRINESISDALITISSFTLISSGTILAFRLFRFIHETFFRLIITGTIIAVTGVLSGLIVTAFVYRDKLAFEGLYFLLPAMIIETVFLSAALGFRLKLAYQEKQNAQDNLLEETKKSEQLALQAAFLLQKELNIQNLQQRISKDLHDDVGASLSSIQIYSAVAMKLLDEQPEKAKKILEQISDNAHAVIETMSDIIWAMQADTEEASLSAKIKNFGYELLTAANIDCNYLINDELNYLFKEVQVRRNIYLLIKEAFNNIAKYSAANQASIKLYREGKIIKIVIKDNGQGFNPDTVKRGNGINNMQERARLLGGEYNLITRIGEGTIVSVNLPMTIFSDTTILTV